MGMTNFKQVLSLITYYHVLWIIVTRVIVCLGENLIIINLYFNLLYKISRVICHECPCYMRYYLNSYKCYPNITAFIFRTHVLYVKPCIFRGRSIHFEKEPGGVGGGGGCDNPGLRGGGGGGRTIILHSNALIVQKRGYDLQNPLPGSATDIHSVVIICFEFCA